MNQQIPFYDPNKSYEENMEKGPYGVFAENFVYENENTTDPTYSFLGHPVYFPFGIPAGPLINSNYVIAALRAGFDIPIYKTVRTRAYPCHEWPNVLAVDVGGDLTIEKAKRKLIAHSRYSPPLSITNSFGVPSRDPDFWQADMARAAQAARHGQVVVGSFQGTKTGGSFTDFVQDYVVAARLVKETGIKIMEMNLSCPNEGTSHLLCFDIKAVRAIVEAVKNEIGNAPLILKLAYFPVGTVLRELAAEVGKLVQGFAAINTIAAPVVDQNGDQALPGAGRLMSGVCGNAIKWAGLESVRRLKFYREELKMNYAIIGVGGVSNPQDYIDYKKAGADVVMSATGSMWNPYLAQEVKEHTRVPVAMLPIESKPEHVEGEIIKMLKSVGAVLTDDHFVYTSGKHGSVYVNKDALYPHTARTAQVGSMFAEKFKKYDIDTVVAPALGGIVLSQWTAFYLSRIKNKEVFGIYTEKTAEKNQVFTRGYDKHVKGKNVLVIEDLTTTGGSVKKVVDSVRQSGGVVIAVAVMVNRNEKEVNSALFDAPFYSLGMLPAVAYDESDCPLCKKNIPINTTIGHGKKYLEQKQV